MRILGRALKSVIISGCLFTSSLVWAGQFSNKVYVDPDFKSALDILSQYGPVTTKPVFQIFHEHEMKSLSSPAQANLYYSSKKCLIAMKEYVSDDYFLKNLMAATGWEQRKALLFILAHEMQHCEDFAKLDRILHGEKIEAADEVLRGLIPVDSWIAGMTTDADPWSAYISKSTDPHMQRIAEASSDIGALVIVHKAYGITIRQVRGLAKLRADENQVSYDHVHNTSPWLWRFINVLETNNKSIKTGSPDIIKTLNAQQTSSFIYRLLKSN